MDRRDFFRTFLGKNRCGLRDRERGLVARINRNDCLAWNGSDCMLCYVRCPLSDEAIFLEDLKPVIGEERCTGCGICEQACAIVNDRAAIRVASVRR